MPPTRERTALKVKGPIWSMPTDWATKAVPQMKAVKNKRNRFFAGNWFMGISLLTLFSSYFLGRMVCSFL